jgi:hypothetical protein
MFNIQINGRKKGLRRNFKNFVSWNPRDDIQTNIIKEIINELKAVTNFVKNWLVFNI